MIAVDDSSANEKPTNRCQANERLVGATTTDDNAAYECSGEYSHQSTIDEPVDSAPALNGDYVAKSDAAGAATKETEEKILVERNGKFVFMKTSDLTEDEHDRYIVEKPAARTKIHQGASKSECDVSGVHKAGQVTQMTSYFDI